MLSIVSFRWVHKLLVGAIKLLFTALLYFLLNSRLMQFLKMDSRSMFKPGTCFTGMTDNGILRSPVPAPGSIRGHSCVGRNPFSTKNLCTLCGPQLPLPRYTSITRGAFLTSCGVPWAMRAPKSNTTTR
ncbi:hypothetical protein MBAV_005252 [Candidatus Magnetobacterium bavaricum]|uniref:Uncharacterized protein n=1 Tax=Candidatus Magnetobacterium bavaricum TaxID=29290 RepID=A0A0F3GL47_9BACT|nr:hypothetical protein MBAV_005252 [Candidatus Magnetobacterium bavaricum]